MTRATRRKLEIIIEAPMVGQVERILADEGVRGWSVFAGVEGRGVTGEWRADGFSGAEEMRLVIALAGDDAAERVLTRLAAFLDEYPGIVCDSEVRVLRAERF